MPVSPNATETLSGGSGITNAAFVQRVLRDRFEDNPHTERAGAALDGAGVTDTLAQPAGCLQRFHPGGWIDFVADGTFENLIVESRTDTVLTLRRAARGSTIAAHDVDAVFRYRGDYDPNTIVNNISESLDKFWPDIFEVRHVDWTVPASPVDWWWSLPTDAEKVLQLWQRDTGTVTNLRSIGFSGPHFMDSGFVTTKKAIQARGVGTSAPDNRLHGIYIARCDIARLTTQQITLLTYEVAMSSLIGAFTGDSKAERRSGLEGAPDRSTAAQMWAMKAEDIRKREAKRLAEYLPRRDRVTYRGLKHYSDDSNFGAPYHPVRPY